PLFPYTALFRSGPSGEILEGGKGCRAPVPRDPPAGLLGKAADPAKTEANAQGLFATAADHLFEAVVVMAGVDVHGQHRDAVAPGVLDQLRGGIKPHGLAVEK